MKIENLKLRIVVLMALFLFPFVSFAQIEITEIMYDLDGTDSGREWVEICNTGVSSINISGWKFFENGTNHTLAFISGSEELGSGEVAVIVSDDSKFLLDWPSFSGNLFDSSFSLSNTGESLEIKDENLNNIDSVSYLSEWGGSGDGNSITKLDGIFSGQVPTPGSASCKSSNTNLSVVLNTSSGTWIDSIGEILVDIGEDEVLVVGEIHEFEAYSLGTEGDPLDADRYRWNFGDGFSGEGQRVLHSYAHPGTYIVFIDVVSGAYATSDRKTVTAVAADISISSVVSGEDGYIEIINDTDYELDISGWHLRGGGRLFKFPEHTIISNVSPIRFINLVTGIKEGDVEMLFPNGDVVVLEKKINTYEPRIEKQPEIAVRTQVSEDKPFEKEPIVEPQKEEKALQNTSSVVMSADKDDGDSFVLNIGLLKWLVALLVLIAGASIGVIIIRHEEEGSILNSSKGDKKPNIKKIAKSIEIVE